MTDTTTDTADNTEPRPGAPLNLISEHFAFWAASQMGTKERTPRLITHQGQEFTAIVLGFGSSFSESEDHNGHMPGTPPGTERCPVCRWADIAILRVVPEDDAASSPYVLATMGKTEVEGESDRIKTVWTTDPEGVWRNLYVTKRGAAPDGGNTLKMPLTNARAFRYAAYADPGIREVLDEYDDMIPDVQDKRAHRADLGFK